MASVIGLIPNCAISVMLTILYLKHTISFGSLIAGLCSAGGLGVLVLLKRNNDKKDTALILGLMVLISTVIGLIFQYNLQQAIQIDFLLDYEKNQPLIGKDFLLKTLCNKR